MMAKQEHTTTKVLLSKDNMKCPKCQKENLDDNVYCTYCGEKMNSSQEGKKCPYCHKQIASDSKFCCFCGKELEWSVYCPKCGTKNNSEEKFCKNCHSVLRREEFNTSNVVIQNMPTNKYDDSALALSIISLSLIIISWFMSFILNVIAIILAIIALVQTSKGVRTDKTNAAKIMATIAIVINSMIFISYVLPFILLL